jgi:hypothetical protein
LKIGAHMATSLRLLLLTLAFVGVGQPAMAAGDTSFRRECGEGAYLTGFKGKAGAWIDHMMLVCAYWIRETRTLGTPSANSSPDWILGRSDGGNPKDAYCPPGAAIAGGYTTYYARWGEDKVEVVHRIAFYCSPINAKGESVALEFGSDWPHEPGIGGDGFDNITGRCPEGQFASGVEADHALYITSFKLLCRAAPPNVEVVTSRTDSPIYRDTGAPRTNPGNIDDMVAAGTPPAPSTPPPLPPAKTAKVVLPVDVYDAPGGAGAKIGELAAETIVGFDKCQADSWCHVTGANVAPPKNDGWVYSGPDYKSLQPL